jgi:hypothetical protein
MSKLLRFNSFIYRHTMNLKSIVLGGVTPLVKMLDPAAGAELDKAQAYLEDNKLTIEEATDLACGAIDVAVEHWPAGTDALNSLKANIREDIPAAEKIVADVERTIGLFKAIGQPA